MCPVCVHGGGGGQGQSVSSMATAWLINGIAHSGHAYPEVLGDAKEPPYTYEMCASTPTNTRGSQPGASLSIYKQTS